MSFLKVKVSTNLRNTFESIRAKDSAVGMTVWLNIQQVDNLPEFLNPFLACGVLSRMNQILM